MPKDFFSSKCTNVYISCTYETKYSKPSNYPQNVTCCLIQTTLNLPHNNKHTDRMTRCVVQGYRRTCLTSRTVRRWTVSWRHLTEWMSSSTVLGKPIFYMSARQQSLYLFNWNTYSFICYVLSLEVNVVLEI